LFSLLDICSQRGYKVIEGDVCSIPLNTSTYDTVICIAVLHHIATEQRRLDALSELLRITKLGGNILLSAWALEQDTTSRRRFESQDVLVAWNVPTTYLEGHDQQNENELQPESSPLIADLSQPKLCFQRYCHVYAEGELENLFQKIGKNKLIQRYYDRGNWCVIVQKTE
jgi:ubiquinone/menaquinone biosynthesis C-methylase UbiE